MITGVQPNVFLQLTQESRVEQPRVSRGQSASNSEPCRLQTTTQPRRKKTDLGGVNKKGIAGDQTNKPPSQEQRTPAASQLRVLKTEREVSIANLQVEPPPHRVRWVGQDFYTWSSLCPIPLARIFISCGCCNRTATAWVASNQKYILSQFWWPEVQAHMSAGPGSL